MDPLQTPTAFDLTTAQQAITGALVSFVRISIGGESPKDDPQAGEQLFENIKNAITAGMSACTEVKRLTDSLTVLRNRHQPRPHADPDKPGALCAACSLHGAIVAWPCEAWAAADRILTHGQP